MTTEEFTENWPELLLSQTAVDDVLMAGIEIGTEITGTDPVGDLLPHDRKGETFRSGSMAIDFAISIGTTGGLPDDWADYFGPHTRVEDLSTEIEDGTFAYKVGNATSDGVMVVVTEGMAKGTRTRRGSHRIRRRITARPQSYSPMLCRGNPRVNGWRPPAGGVY